MTDNEKMRESVLKILASYKQEMERYGYYSSNPGVSVDDFEEIADEIVAWQVAQAEPVEVFDSHCNYASFAGRVCNKCGRIHDGGKSVAVVREPVAQDKGE